MRKVDAAVANPSVSSIESVRNCFNLFQLPESFALEQSRLDAEYEFLQRRLHEDVTSCDATPAEVNACYKTLLDPCQRAVHILAINSVYLDEETDRASHKAFLLSIYSMYEELESINTEAELRRFAGYMNTRCYEVIAEMQELYSHRNWEQFADCTRKLKYLSNVVSLAKKRILEF